MDLSFKNGPWHVFFEGQSGQYNTQLLFDGQSTVLSLVWDIQGKETVGLALECLKVFVSDFNPGALIEKAGFDCIEIAKKESQELHWFMLINSGASYAPLNQKKVDTEMEAAYFLLVGNEKKLFALTKALGFELKRLEDSNESEKKAFFGSPIVHKTLSHRIEEQKKKMETPQQFVVQKNIAHGEIVLGTDKQKQVIQEPLGLFRRTLITDGTPLDRFHALHVLIESALLSSVPCVVFDSQSLFEGLRTPSKESAELKKMNMEPVGFPITTFSAPDKLRINLSVLDIDAVLELFRAGKSPSTQTVQKILSSNRATNFSQLIEAIKTQSPLGETTSYQLKKAVRLVLLIEKNYPGFFNGPNETKEIAKTWGSGFGRAALVQLEGLDSRIKTILFHALLRELMQFVQTMTEQQPIKIMVFLPEAQFLFPRHAKWKIHQLIEEDLGKASALGIGSVISTEKTVELTSALLSGIQSQISIVNQDDVGIRIENRKPYRLVLRPPLSECQEKQNQKTALAQEALEQK